jgi:PAS domain S-box-containing protein
MHSPPLALPGIDAAAFGWQLFERSPDCIKLLSLDGRLLALNRNGQRALEIDDVAAVLGQPWAALWSEESRASVEAALAAARGGADQRFEAPCPTLRGKTRWWDVNVSLVPDAGGQPAVLLAVSRDITAMRQVERELQAANRSMRDVFHQAPAFMCVLRGPEHVYEMINERYLQLVGYRDLVGRKVRDALPELAAQGYVDLLDRVYRSGEPFIGADLPLMLQRAPGQEPEERYIDLAFTALRDAEGGISGLLVHGIDQTDRKLAELAQRADRERMQLAAEAAELGLWTWRPEDDMVHWENARLFEIFGLSPEQPPVNAARFLQEFIHPDDAPGFGAAVARTLERGAPLFFHGRIRRSDGEQRWIEVFGRARQSQGEGPPQLVGAVSDITERKLAELALHETRERFEKIVSQAATGVVQLDVAGNITFANGKFCEMLGYAPGELVGRHAMDVTAPDSLPATAAAMRKLREDGIGFVIDKHYLRRDGGAMPATSSVNALRGPQGEFQGMVAIVLDTTESKRAAERLRASEERYRTLFESMDQGFCIIDMLFDAAGQPVDYRFIEMNRMFERHTGLSNAVGRTALELVPALDRFWIETYGRVATTGEAARFESEARAMGRWFDVYATRIGGPGSVRVALLFSDITSRKASEDRLRTLADGLAEADRRKTEFLATLAHELRNPLAPIRSGLAVIRLSGDNPAAVGKVREMMERQVGHMVHLIDDLLDVARISGGKLELKKSRVDLRTVLSSAVETSLPAVEAGRHVLDLELAGEALMADADATRIAQVVANLLNNAAKYTPAGGRIRLSARREAGTAVIAVSDTGVGIPAESLDSVFDMFNQVGRNLDRAQGGLGIGLSLVRRLVEMHEGTVEADSAGSGMGSVFTVRLPLAHDAVDAPARAATPPQAAPTGGARVLVVDDNVDAAATLSMVLEMNGHATRIAHDGQAGLAAARAFAPQVVFLDIGMPGMNGYETARAMRALPELAGVVLVALTGWGADSDRSQSSEAGFDHHLTKPVQLEAVEAILALAARQPGSA